MVFSDVLTLPLRLSFREFFVESIKKHENKAAVNFSRVVVARRKTLDCYTEANSKVTPKEQGKVRTLLVHIGV